MYEKGRGVRTDYQEATRWYQKASEQGYAPAQYNLGVLFDKGRGVSRDWSEARRWYQKAADQGYLLAQYNLGLLYLNGQGTPQDYVLAHMWIDLAATTATGDDRKRYYELLDTVSAKMNIHQIAEADRLASAWKPSAGK